MSDRDDDDERTFARTVVHELRNVAFGLVTALDEVAAHDLPDNADRGVKYAQTLAARVGEIAHLLAAAHDRPAATQAPLDARTIAASAIARAEVDGWKVVGETDAIALGDAGALVAAIGYVVAAANGDDVERTIALRVNDEAVSFLVSSSRKTMRSRALVVALARLLVGRCGGSVTDDGNVVAITTRRR